MPQRVGPPTLEEWGTQGSEARGLGSLEVGAVGIAGDVAGADRCLELDSRTAT